MAVAFLPLVMWVAFYRTVNVPILAVAAWALAVVPFFQLGTGLIVYRSDALMAFLYLSGFGLVVLTGFRYARSSDKDLIDLTRITALWVAILLAGIVSMGIAFHQWLDLRLLGLFLIELPPNARVYANLAQPNHFATLLLLSLTGLLFLFEAGKIRPSIGLIAAFLLAFGLVMTGSRSVLLAWCWFLLLFITLRRRCQLRVKWEGIAAVASFYLVISLMWSSINEWLLLGDGVTSAVDRLNPGVRTIYWESMLKAISLAPWQGYGWGQIPAAQQATALAYPPTHTFFESSHNLFLDLILWNGLPIGLAVVLLLSGWFFLQYRKVHDALSWCLLLGVGFVFSHAMVELPLNYAYFLFPVGFWMGVLNANSGWVLRDWRPWAAKRIVRPALISIVIATAVLFILVLREYPAFEEDWQNMRYEEARIGNNVSPPARALLLNQLEELLRFTRTQASPGMTAEQLNWMREVSRRYAYSSALFRYATAAGLNGDKVEAKRALQLLCSLHPVATCSEARMSWTELSKSKWPQLSDIQFPAMPPEK